ncbi:MAG: amidase [Rhodobacteraceae bacterium]|nr:amidase [Paracoccaceae bacterium]
MTMKSNLLSATEIARKIKSGQTTASNVMQDCLVRIREREELIGAFSFIDYDEALKLAEMADKNPTDGPLSGVPFAIKDIIDVEGYPITQGSSIYQNRTPRKNAECIKRLIEAGAIPIGITVSTEFACFTPGKTVNPHNPTHTPGGSSSGSAAAVADKMIPFGLGSQTAASLVRPGSYCGIFAYKSSNGYLSLEGVLALSSSLDSLGVLARSPDDLQLVRSVLGEDQQNSINFEVKPRIAFMKGPHWDKLSEDARVNFEKSFVLLKEKGSQVKYVDHPKEFNLLTEAHKTIMTRDISQSRGFEYENCRSQLSDKFIELVEEGLAKSDEDYMEALSARNRGLRVLSLMYNFYDVIIAPATSGEAPKGLMATGDPLFSRDWTLLQLPAVSMPFGKGKNNLPLSLQLIGWYGKDQNLIDYAARINNLLSEV